MIIRIIFIVAVITFLFNCSSRKNFVVMLEYEEQKITDKKLVIAPLIPEPIIENRMDIINKFGDGVPEKVYDKYFRIGIIKQLKRRSYFGEITFADIDTSNFINTELIINEKDTTSFIIPNSEMIFINDTVNTDFVLLIHDLIISQIIQGGSVHAVGPIMMGVPAYSNSIQYAKYIIWDNNEKRLVKFGVFKTQGLLFGPMMKEILYDTPFENRKVNRKRK